MSDFEVIRSFVSNSDFSEAERLQEREEAEEVAEIPRSNSPGYKIPEAFIFRPGVEIMIPRHCCLRNSSERYHLLESFFQHTIRNN